MLRQIPARLAGCLTADPSQKEHCPGDLIGFLHQSGCQARSITVS